MGSLITDTTVEVKINGAALNSMLRGENGLVHQNTIDRAIKVQNRARVLVPVHTGKLRDSLHKLTIRDTNGLLALLVGSPVSYAYMVHEGTPAHYIRPVRAKFLRFPGRDGRIIYTKLVHHPGTKPRRFLTDALPAGRE